MGTIGQAFGEQLELAQTRQAQMQAQSETGADPFGQYSKGVTCSSAVLLLLAIATTDRLTGAALHVHMLYIVPVGIITWAAGRGWGLVASFAAMGISIATFYSQRLYSEDYLYYWEAAIGLAALAVVVVVLHRLRDALAAAQARP
jgi:hypothetical protein